MSFDKEQLIRELKIKAIRSSGSGGQHVNKVSSKIELTLNLKESSVFNEQEKERLFSKLKTRLTKENNIIVYCGDTRSQHKNKDLAIQRLIMMLREALVIPKYRKPTKIPRSKIKKRLKNKRLKSERKANRKKPEID